MDRGRQVLVAVPRDSPETPQGEDIKNRDICSPLSRDPYRRRPGEAPPKLKNDPQIGTITQTLNQAQRRRGIEDGSPICPPPLPLLGKHLSWGRVPGRRGDDWVSFHLGPQSVRLVRTEVWKLLLPPGPPWVCWARMDAVKLTTKLKYS
ncbi:hypothetical protein NDU88_003327 [Pleurodeles waltl]|uniref:Uncharacterized protein n=1 Tax=Pleurodeles waltl TaxID=8319 RepID=A0AAV7MS46_PLEWA|nr:hypothetical protein NDU88_003327 [Pleurodeles waltl]